MLTLSVENDNILPYIYLFILIYDTQWYLKATDLLYVENN